MRPPSGAASFPRRRVSTPAYPRLRQAAYVAGLVLLAINLLQFPTRSFDYTHDLGSQATYEYLAAHDFQFGVQVYQNVGPYGFLHYGDTYSGYLHVQKVVLKNLWRLVLFLLILWTLRWLPGPVLKACWGVSFFVFLPVDYGEVLDWESPFACLTIYLAALYLLQDRRDRLYGVVCGALLGFLALVALTKHTSFVLAAFVVLLVAADKVVRKRPVAGCWMPAVFVGFLLLYWKLANQALANFVPFVIGIGQFSSGYNEAMMYNESTAITALALVIFGLFFAGSLSNCLFERQPWSRCVIETFLLFILWKQAFVRAITITSPCCFLPCGCSPCPFCLRFCPQGRRRPGPERRRGFGLWLASGRFP